MKLLALFAVYLILCVCFYTYYEGWPASVALSFVVETMSTVGKFTTVQSIRNIVRQLIPIKLQGLDTADHLTTLPDLSQS